MFTNQSMNFDNLQGNFAGLGNIPSLNNAKRVVFSCWIHYGLSGWPENRVLIGNFQTVSFGRQFRIMARNNVGVGDIQITIGTGSTSIISAYVPKGTFSGTWWHHLMIWIDCGSNQMGCFVDGKVVTLTGQTGPLPPQFISNNFATLIGAQTGTSPTFFWLGQMQNVALWIGDDTGWIPSLAQAQSIWAKREAIDLRTISGVPTPHYYIPGNEFPFREVISGNLLSGSLGISNNVVPVAISTDEMFEHRFEMFNGFEPWLGNAQNGGGHYAATPSLAFDGNGRLIGSYNRSDIHGAGQAQGFLHASFDELSWPIGARSWPLDPTNNSPVLWPYGDLSDPTSSRRNFTLTRFPGLGERGVDRWITPFNEDGWINPQPDGKMRRLWISVCDGDPLVLSNWKTPYEFQGAGTRWNSVGRARVVRLPDGSMLFGYYYQHQNESRYTAGVARSLDNGLTWEHFSNIIQDPDPNGTPYEEPHLMFINNQLIAFVRVDFGAYVRRVLRFTSNDGGASWSAPADVMGGWQNPVYLYRPSDGILISLQRTDGGGNIELSYPMIQISKDLGATWGPEVKIPSPFLNRSGQGDFCLLPDDKIAIAWGQDIDGYTNQRTRMWFGIFKDCFIDALKLMF